MALKGLPSDWEAFKDSDDGKVYFVEKVTGKATFKVCVYVLSCACVRVCMQMYMCVCRSTYDVCVCARACACA